MALNRHLANPEVTRLLEELFELLMQRGIDRLMKDNCELLLSDAQLKAKFEQLQQILGQEIGASQLQDEVWQTALAKIKRAR